MLAEAALTKIAEKALDTLLSRGIDALIKEKIDPTLKGIERIEEKIDRQLLMHLQAGITFLRLREYEQAVSELVRAHAVDRLSPVSLFWLSAALALRGRDGDARDFMAQALTGNPYLIDGGTFLATPMHSPELIEPAVLDVPAWEAQVSVLGLHPGMHPSWIRRWTKDKGVSSVSAISLAGSRILIQCFLARAHLTLAHENQPYKAGYDSMCVAALSTKGHVLWANKTRDKLLFATPAFAIFQKDGGFRLASMEDGATIREFDHNYMQTAFCPDLPNLMESDRFRLANKKLSWPGDMLSRINRSHPGETSVNERGAPVSECELISDGEVFFSVKNAWRKGVMHMQHGGSFQFMACQAQLSGH